MSAFEVTRIDVRRDRGMSGFLPAWHEIVAEQWNAFPVPEPGARMDLDLPVFGVHECFVDRVECFYAGGDVRVELFCRIASTVQR